LSKAFSCVLLGTSLAAACGGQSLSNDGDSGAAGDGSSDGGTSGSGASPSGGTAGSSTGGLSGTSFGGTSFGGTTLGGTSSGGSSSGGVAGTSGSAGAGGVCSLPLESGPCEASVPSFGFSQADGHCIPFTYGGCEGNANRFSTLTECEAKCGGSLSKCPPEMPMSAGRCSSTGQVCTYDFGNCLCAPTGSRECLRVDQACDGWVYDGGELPIVLAVYQQCTCLARGQWECVTVMYGGGPP
jgi:hypothetical protein